MNTTRIMNPQLHYQQAQVNSLNATFVVEEKSDGSPQTPPKRITASPAKGVKSPAVSKRAKQKWEILERKVCKTATYSTRKTQEQCFLGFSLLLIWGLFASTLPVVKCVCMHLFHLPSIYTQHTQHTQHRYIDR